jgi:hypothetical protein
VRERERSDEATKERQDHGDNAGLLIWFLTDQGLPLFTEEEGVPQSAEDPLDKGGYQDCNVVQLQMCH